MKIISLFILFFMISSPVFAGSTRLYTDDDLDAYRDPAPYKNENVWQNNNYNTSYSTSRGKTSYTRPGARTTYVGPRGGIYHYSNSGRKVYEKRK